MPGSELRNYVANYHASYQRQAIRFALSWAVCLLAVILQIRGRVTDGSSMIIRNVASCNSFFWKWKFDVLICFLISRELFNSALRGSRLWFSLLQWNTANDVSTFRKWSGWSRSWWPVSWQQFFVLLHLLTVLVEWNITCSIRFANWEVDFAVVHAEFAFVHTGHVADIMESIGASDNNYMR